MKKSTKKGKRRKEASFSDWLACLAADRRFDASYCRR
jgi:hypothetical protein